MGGMMDIRPRSAWGARTPRARTPVGLSYWRGIRVHHSAGPVGQSLRTIQDFHMDTRRWVDIGYNHLIQSGQVWTGRGFRARPAHDGINDTLGVCLVGTYTSSLPADEDLEALAAYIRHARELTGADLPVSGHRDAAGAQTACPGQRLYDHLPTIRQHAEEDDMATPEEIAHAVWNRINPVNEIVYGSMVRYMHNAIRPDRQQTDGAVLGIRRDLARLEELVEAAMAAVGSGGHAEVLERIDAHHAERMAAFDAAAQERQELAELVRQGQSGEMEAAAVVDELARRLAADEPTDDGGT